MADTSGIKELIGGIYNLKAASANKKAAREQNKQQLDLIKSLDWTPTTTAELAPTYQRSQSPVARSYLESFLLGSNPDSVMPGDPMAAQKKRQMQYAQNQQFGTPEQRIAQQNAYRATTPWAVQPAAARAQKEQAKSQAESQFAAANPDAVKLGLDQKLYNKLEDAGVFRGGLSEQAVKNPEVVRSLAELGDYDALRALIPKWESDGGRPVKARRERKSRERQAQAIVDRERARLREIEES